MLPRSRLGVAWRQPAASQIPRPRFDQADDLRAGAGVVERRHPEPDAIFRQNRPMGGGPKVVEPERAVWCFDPTDAFPPPFDASGAVGQFEPSDSVAVIDAGAGDDP